MGILDRLFGESTRCGQCGRSLKVKYHDASRIAVASPSAIRNQALKCQDCGFVVCYACTLGASGEGIPVCPRCKSQGGPYFFTR